jgi:hypothetical protein
MLSEMMKIIGGLSEITRQDWIEALGPTRKAKPPVLYVAHSVFFAQPSHGGRPYPMALKIMMADQPPADDPVGAVKLAHELTHHMQSLI